MFLLVQVIPSTGQIILSLKNQTQQELGSLFASLFDNHTPLPTHISSYEDWHCGFEEVDCIRNPLQSKESCCGVRDVGTYR